MRNHWPRKSKWLLAMTTCLALACGPVLASHKHHHHDDDSSNSKSSSSASSLKADVNPAQVAASAHTASAAAPSAPTPASPVSATDIPDYGGRDNVVSATTGTGSDAPSSPMAQAWRAFQALVIVLVMMVGALYLIKKYGLIKDTAFGPSGTGKAPAGVAGMLLTGWHNVMRTATQNGGSTPRVASGSTDPTAALTVLSSTPLPGAAPASVHVVEVAGRRFLLGATGGGVTLLSDWESEPAADSAADEALPNEDERFESYLNRMGMTNQTPPEVVGERVSQTTDRLQALLERAREESGQ